MTISKAEELTYSNPIKALMMLLVVLYHSCAMWMGGWFSIPQVDAPLVATFAQWLNTFHVPVFVFFSGYIYCYLKFETDKYSNFGMVMRKKVCRLLIPYAFICAIWAMPFWAFYYGPEKLIEKYVLAGSPSQLWFIVMLFMMFLTFELLTKAFSKKILEMKFINLVFCGLCYCSGVILGHFLPVNVAQISTTFMYVPIFWLGMALRQMDLTKFWNTTPLIFLFAHAALFVMQLSATANEGLVATVAQIALWPIIRIAGIFMAVSICGRLMKKTHYLEKSPPKPLTLFEQYSFQIYLLHQQIIWVVISVLNEYLIPVPIFIFANFAISILVSLAISIVLDKCKITRFLLGR